MLAYDRISGLGAWVVHDQRSLNFAAAALQFGLDRVAGRVVTARHQADLVHFSQLLTHPEGESVPDHPALNLILHRLFFSVDSDRPPRQDSRNTRIQRFLTENRQITFVGDLVSQRRRDLLLAKNFGPSCLEAVESTLARMGLRLDMNTAGWKRPT